MLTNVRSVRPVALTDTFKAWKLAGGIHHPLRIEASTLENAKLEAQSYCLHKDQFVILAVEDGKQTVRLYQIKQGKEIWVRSPSTGNTVKSHQLKADLVSEMQVEAYAPVEPWQWSRDADCVGAERGVVNA